MSSCSKPGCSRIGVAVLGYDYAQKLASLEDPSPALSPHSYILCTSCAERLNPPRGWTLEDRRSEPPLFASKDRAVTILERQEEEIVPEGPARQLFFGHSA
ncbi:MAG: DUF3499 family protein [Actinomycetota bacterium]